MRVNELQVGECYRCRNHIMVCESVTEIYGFSHTHSIRCNLISVSDIEIRHKSECNLWADMVDEFEPFPRKRFDQILALYNQFHSAVSALLNENQSNKLWQQ